MQKDEYFRSRKTPLLIGGATTSRVHTAVKIAPHYEGPVVYVPDASRSVGVASGLLGEQSAAYLEELKADYARVREQHAGKKQPPLSSLQVARANKAVLDWDTYVPVAPKFTGRREFRNFDLAEISRFIDWAPFFQTWDLAGPFPAILQDPVVGVEASKVYADAQAMLKRLIEGRWLSASAVLGLYPANSVNDDDIEIYADTTRAQVLMTWRGLRQQIEKPSWQEDGKTVQPPNRCLADFVAPRSTGKADYVGLFAVTAGLGVERIEQRFVDAHDDYSAIMFKALADRLAEALAECLHHRVRTDLWGYAAQEALSSEELIAEKYQGIRPAPGYPACPDHRVKEDLFSLLQATEIGMSLTENLAMAPAASVCGFYLAHPQARYFNVGKIGEDQLQDHARRSGVGLEVARRALAPNL